MKKSTIFIEGDGMPFKSRNQLKKCYALKAQGKAGSWDCDEWSKETKNIKKLPEAVKTSMDKMINSFEKIAKKLFNPIENPPVPQRVIQQNMIQQAKEKKMGGATPVEHRNKLTADRTGIIQKNKESDKMG